MSVLGSVKLRIAVLFYFYYHWADPHFWQDFFLSLKERCHIAQEPTMQHTKKRSLKTRTVHEKLGFFVFLSFSQRDTLHWNLSSVPRQNYILRV